MQLYKRKFAEMAQIGRVDNMIVQVFTDHNPPHFHVRKKDEFEVKISIKNLKIVGYVFQKPKKEISSKELDKLNDWLKEPSLRNKKISNLEAIQFVWDSMNE